MMKNGILFVLTSILSLGFLLNYIWEKLHIALYANYENFVASLPLPVAIYTSIIDASIILAIYLGIALLRQNILWIKNMRMKDAVLAIFSGIIIAFLIEWNGLAREKWEYNQYMPLVPLVKIGLSPLLQMGILPLVTFFAVKKIHKKFSQ